MAEEVKPHITTVHTNGKLKYIIFTDGDGTEAWVRAEILKGK